MRFDWYQPTIADKPQVILDELLARLAPGGQIVEGSGRHNYKQSFTVQTRDGDRAALLLCGGTNGHPNVTASGAACDAFVPVVRGLWPEHRLSRVDVAEDFCREGAYETLERACGDVFREMGVKGRRIVPDCVADGRTYYGGSFSSDVFTRLYDKTAEARKHLPAERHSEVPEHWARLEAVVRPRRDVKSLACQMQPSQFWGCARWTARLAEVALGLEVERIQMNPARESDDDRAYRFMLKQYGKTFVRLLKDHGSWSAVGAQIGEDLKRMANRR